MIFPDIILWHVISRTVNCTFVLFFFFNTRKRHVGFYVFRISLSGVREVLHVQFLFQAPPPKKTYVKRNASEPTTVYFGILFQRRDISETDPRYLIWNRRFVPPSSVAPHDRRSRQMMTRGWKIKHTDWKRQNARDSTNETEFNTRKTSLIIVTWSTFLR